MLKVVACFKRRPDLTPEEFRSHWRGPHAELVARLPGLERYVQNPTLDSGYDDGEPFFDGVAEAWFEDSNALRVSGESDEYRAVKKDEENFIDDASLGSVITTETEVVSGSIPLPGVKVIAFLNKLPDLAVARFQSYWRDSHGPIAAAIPGIRRYLQCHTYWGIYDAGRKPLYDGVSMSWFDGLEDLVRIGGSPEYQAALDDTANFIPATGVTYVIAREVEIPIDDLRSPAQA